MWDVQPNFGQRLLTSSFKWNSIFVGVNVNDEVFRKIPTEGQALFTLFGEFSDVTFSSEESSRSIDLLVQCLMMNPRHAKSKGKAKGLCYCVALYFHGVVPPVVPKVNRNPSGSTAMGAPKSTPVEATSQVRRGRTIVQACLRTRKLYTQEDED